MRWGRALLDEASFSDFRLLGDVGAAGILMCEIAPLHGPQGIELVSPAGELSGSGGRGFVRARRPSGGGDAHLGQAGPESGSDQAAGLGDTRPPGISLVERGTGVIGGRQLDQRREIRKQPHPELRAMSSNSVPGPTPASPNSLSLAARAYGSIRYAQSAARSPHAWPDSTQLTHSPPASTSYSGKYPAHAALR